MEQAKLELFIIAPRYKYGYKIPKNFNNVQRLDKEKGNAKWVDSNSLEHEQLKE